ncbi:hypothetical protein [Streptomyces sp. NPDC008139]|uniref:hypothetical protein n=1 Tax=Streptomyces sp. NPDC008139 TaxID=3364814 RepID=UPI0036ECE53A
MTSELDNVRTLLGTSADAEPDYCSKPAKYSAAAPYRKGTNYALFPGDDEYTRKLPGSWSAGDVTKAVLVVCVGDRDYGTTVTTCPYENKRLPDFPREVKFRKIAIPVKVFDLRTGKLVSSRTVRIGGGSCPGYGVVHHLRHHRHRAAVRGVRHAVHVRHPVRVQTADRPLKPAAGSGSGFGARASVKRPRRRAAARPRRARASLHRRRRDPGRGGRTAAARRAARRPAAPATPQVGFPPGRPFSAAVRTYSPGIGPPRRCSPTSRPCRRVSGICTG